MLVKFVFNIFRYFLATNDMFPPSFSQAKKIGIKVVQKPHMTVPLKAMTPALAPRIINSNVRSVGKNLVSTMQRMVNLINLSFYKTRQFIFVLP